jgi:hypothetical protein
MIPSIFLSLIHTIDSVHNTAAPGKSPDAAVSPQTDNEVELVVPSSLRLFLPFRSLRSFRAFRTLRALNPFGAI